MTDILLDPIIGKNIGCLRNKTGVTVRFYYSGTTLVVLPGNSISVSDDGVQRPETLDFTMEMYLKALRIVKQHTDEDVEIYRKKVAWR